MGRCERHVVRLCSAVMLLAAGLTAGATAQNVEEDQVTTVETQLQPAPQAGVSGAAMPATRPVLPRPVLAPPATRPAEDPAERLPATRPAAAATVPSAADLAEARKRIWKQFREDYDRRSPAERAALGHKLLKLALTGGGDDAARFALLREVHDLAVSCRDERLAMKSADAVSFYFSVDPVAQKMAALSAARWPADDEPQARALLDDWLAVSKEAQSRESFDAAIAAAQRAGGVAQAWGDDQWVAEAAARLREATAGRDDHQLVESARRALAAKPSDPQANLVVGCDAAAAGEWDKALPMLKLAADPLVRLAATRDAAGAADPGGKINIGDDWVGAAERQRPKWAAAFRLRARHWYSLALPDLNEKDRQQVLARMRNLPGGSIFEAAPPAPGAIKRSALMGGAGGAAFTDLPSHSGVLIGVRYTTGIFPVNHLCIASLQPIFLTDKGKAEGAVHGKANGQAKVIEAKPGFAAGAVVAQTGLLCDGFKIIYMRIKGDALDPSDQYESEWIGGHGSSPITRLAGDGKPIIGIHGRAGDGLDAFGVVQPQSASTSSRENPPLPHPR